jgi:hypothetical protein
MRVLGVPVVYGSILDHGYGAVWRAAQLIPLLQWEEGLGEEVAAVFESGGYLLSLSLSSHGGEGTRRRIALALGALVSWW